MTRQELVQSRAFARSRVARVGAVDSVAIGEALKPIAIGVVGGGVAGYFLYGWLGALAGGVIGFLVLPAFWKEYVAK